ncbi:MAG: hypothetical protein EDQ89_12645 [Acidobacteria bacterium]|nr:MAG: hypothetical protein EDQ89_12645 [Acidobacteriota bacterium]GIK78568.1 MAG: hypothetical protein BroJett022_22580 [Actinomycetes bacterium]
MAIGRRTKSAATAMAVALALPAPAAAAALRAGLYEAAPAQPAGIYQLGTFAVVAEGGKRRIVAAEGYDGIYYPDAGRCDGYEVPLVTERIPINRRGRFAVRERTPVRRGSLRIVWKGAWKKPGRLGGKLRIRYRRCDSTIRWVGRRTGPAAPLAAGRLPD